MKNKLIIILYLIESIALSFLIFGLGEITIDTDFNFPLNKEGALRWITNNLDGYTFDVRGINRIFIGIIMYGLYMVFDYLVVLKIIQILIIFLSLISTYYLLITIDKLLFRDSTSKKVPYIFLVSQLIIFNNFTLFSRFFTQSNLIFSYIYVPVTIYLIFKYIETKKVKYILLINVITLIIPVSQPAYFIVYIGFINLLSLLFINSNTFLGKFINLLKLNLSFISLAGILILYLILMEDVTLPFISTAQTELERNTPSAIQFFTGYEYPLRNFYYCIDSECYYTNYASEYHKNYPFLDYLYMLKYIIIGISILFTKKSRLLYVYLLYIVFVGLVINAQIFKIIPEIALAVRLPYYRFAFPIIILEMTIFLILLRTKLKIIVVSYLTILLLSYYFPIYSGLIYKNSPLFNYRLSLYELKTLETDINKINLSEGPVIYLPYSNTGYRVCFIIANKTIYYFINPFYLFSNKNLLYNSRYFDLNSINVTNFVYRFGSIIIVLEKSPCLANPSISKFDNRQMISIEHLTPIGCSIHSYNLTNFMVYHVKCPNKSN